MSNIFVALRNLSLMLMGQTNILLWSINEYKSGNKCGIEYYQFSLNRFGGMKKKTKQMDLKLNVNTINMK